MYTLEYDYVGVGLADLTAPVYAAVFRRSVFMTLYRYAIGV